MKTFILTKKVGKFTFQIEEVEAASGKAAIESYCRPRGECPKWYRATEKSAS